jgi:hypothetical protein
MARRGTIFVVLFILAAAVIIGASQFLRSQPALEFTLAVSPLAERWTRAAVEAFNSSEPLVNGTQRVRFNIIVIDDIAVWLDDSRANWTPEDHPAAWLPASSASVIYARERRLPFEIEQPSLAQTVLMWGGFARYVNLVTNNGALAFDWQSVERAAKAERWANLPGGESLQGNVNLVFERADSTMGGLGSLLSGAADFNGIAELTTIHVTSSAFQDRIAPMVESVPNFNTLGADPAASMASRGASVGVLGMLPESLWLTNLTGLRRQDEIILSYPAFSIVFDFPLARWSDSAAPPAEAEAVAALGAWLAGTAQRAALVEYGLRPPGGVVAAGAALFDAGLTSGTLPTLPTA